MTDMLTLANIFVVVLIVAVAVPAVTFFVECLLALLPRRAPAVGPGERPRVGIVIPAHDEELLIGETVRSIRSQLSIDDVLIVVADNCSDHTAERAASAGAEVAVRAHATQRGKGYALAFGMGRLRDRGREADGRDAGGRLPEVVIFFDADCPIDAGVVETLAREAVRTDRPVQAAYVLAAETDAGPVSVVSSLAFTVKNIVRPRGLARVGIPCPLTGTGMAFPWDVIADVPLASGEIVEDMQMGINLLRKGKGPVFCDRVRIEGRLPADRAAALGQRTRWEHGHLGVIRRAVLPLLFDGILHRRPSLLLSALDYAVPPLAFLVVLCCGTITAATAVAVFTGNWLCVLFSASVLGLVLAGVIIGWSCFARHLPLASFLSIPGYVLWKLPMYAKFFKGPQTAWVRTARTAAGTQSMGLK